MTTSTETTSAPSRRRTVLVTGGNRGIGLAIARRFQAQGDAVVIMSRSGEDVEGIPAVTGDVTNSESVDAAFAKAAQIAGGPIEVVVANAGIADDGLLMRMSDASFENVVDTNLAGAFRCARAASTGMIRRKGGRIIFVSSVVGLFGSAGQTNYSASKAGLVGLARSIARELGGRGITANVVAPGFIETDMTSKIPMATREVGRRLNSMMQGGNPIDVGEAIAFFAEPGSAGVTGQVLRVCGQSQIGA